MRRLFHQHQVKRPSYKGANMYTKLSFMCKSSWSQKNTMPPKNANSERNNEASVSVTGLESLS